MIYLRVNNTSEAYVTAGFIHIVTSETATTRAERPMTLGFAAVAWPPSEASLIMIAADTRFSANGETLTDAGI
jgi:hypothetical protein